MLAFLFQDITQFKPITQVDCIVITQVDCIVIWCIKMVIPIKSFTDILKTKLSGLGIAFS